MATLANLPADAEAILAEFAAALTEAGIPVPARQYLNPGADVAWDEPQFTIAVTRIYMGEPGAPVGGSLIAGEFHQSVSFGILYLQEISALSDAGLPATANLDSDGQTIIGVATVIWRAAIALRVADKLSPGGGSVVIGPLNPMGPEGGLAGVALQLDMSLL